MAEIKLSFDLSFSRRFLTTAASFAIMLCAVPELDSESVTLSTYYPAPSGVYTNMITTGATYLARDGGNVGVGTTAPGAKMHILGVSQNTLAVDSPSYPEITLRQNGTIRNYNAVATSAGGYFTGSAAGDWIFRQESGASIKFGRGATADLTVDPNGSIIVRDKIDVSGSVMTRVGASCYDASYNYPTPGGGTVALCGGAYVTTVDGMYTKKYVLAGVVFQNTNPTITARCCPCPTGGCTL